jgi:peptide/nickel transport system substrate-binding protein
MKIIKRVLLVLLVSLVSFAAISCQTEEETPTTFRVAKPWDRTGIRNHYHGGANVGAIEWFSVEPLIQYVRSTDEIQYLLAEEIIHNDDHTTIIHIRQGAKWHTGEDFKAEDVAAFFHINHVAITNYLNKPIEIVDDKTVKLEWKEWMEPNDYVKTLLLAEHKVGSVQYTVFKQFVDRALEILESQERVEPEYTGWAPFGYDNSLESEEDYYDNYLSFRAVNPEMFVATGPYKVDRVTQNQMILVKNEDYYFAENVKFDRILAYNVTDITNIYNMLSNGELDYHDGLAPEATLNAILDDNEEMVHVKMFDPGAIGLVFNLEKDIWADDVRLAFQYIFDREEMRNAGNRYAIPSNFPLIGMAPSEAETWMNPTDFANIPTYTQDQQMAASLLEQAGWTFTDDKWYDAQGVLVELSLGYDGSHPGMSGVAEAVSSALENFGITVVLKRAADFGTWFDTAKAEESVYDFSVNWTDLNMSFSYPTGSFIYVLNDINGPIMHLKPFTQQEFDDGLIDEADIGNLNLIFDKADGSGTVKIYKYLTNMYSMSEAELEEALADIVLGFANANYGVQFYQNVTGSFLNSATISGIPLEEYYLVNRNVEYVPMVGSEDFFAVARTNLYFSQALPFKMGDYEPKE